MNEKPPCPKCQSREVVKNGKVQGKQRYKCKSCSLQFTRLTPRGRPAQEKAMAVTLYTLGLSIRAIARLIGVSPTAVLKWIKTFAKTHYEKPAPGDAILVELDEMWHYIKSKKTSLSMRPPASTAFPFQKVRPWRKGGERMPFGPFPRHANRQRGAAITGAFPV